MSILIQDSAPHAVTLFPSQSRAADSILNHSAKAIEIEDIEARVSELERATESSKSRR